MFDNAKEPLMGKHLEFMDQKKFQIKKIVGGGILRLIAKPLMFLFDHHVYSYTFV
jgi:hypothetical protein